MLRRGLLLPTPAFPGVSDAQLFAHVSAIASSAEHAGFDSLWVMDHFMRSRHPGQPRTDPVLDAYTLLGGLAARTSVVKLGTLVTDVTFRNPAHLAKTVTTLDILSAGRAVLGLGAGGDEREHGAYGFAFPPVGERMNRLEEALRICRAMFTDEAPSFTGHYYAISEARNLPRPVQASGPPILVGGAGRRRTLRLVAQYADACNFPVLFGREELRDLLHVLEAHCVTVARDPATIIKTCLRTMVIAATQVEAERTASRLQAEMDLTNSMVQTYWDNIIVGGPAAVREQIIAYLDIGLNGLIVNFLGSYDPDTVALAGEALTGCFVDG